MKEKQTGVETRSYLSFRANDLVRSHRLDQGLQIMDPLNIPALELGCGSVQNADTKTGATRFPAGGFACSIHTIVKIPAKCRPHSRFALSPEGNMQTAGLDSGPIMDSSTIVPGENSRLKLRVTTFLGPAAAFADCAVSISSMIPTCSCAESFNAVHPPISFIGCTLNPSGTSFATVSSTLDSGTPTQRMRLEPGSRSPPCVKLRPRCRWPMSASAS